MPFRKWKVDPVFLSRKPLPPDKPIFETTTNGTLVKCMEQMADLLTLADRIFEEIGAECRLVFERTQKLKVKVEICVSAVSKLDAKAVRVPVSDLETTVHLLRRPQYVTHYDQTSQLFLPSTRPPAVDDLYGKASATPVPLISAIDRYRNDGRKGSQLFMVTPILGDAEKRKRKHRKMLDIETRRPASFALAKDWNEENENDTLLSEPGQVMVSSSVLRQRFKDDGLERLPSPEELVLAASLEYPSSVVPVDTTGSSFLRMIRSRRSLIHVDFVIRRKKSKKKTTKRRHTVCEGSTKELEDALQNISVTDTSCQTDELPEVGSLSSSFRRSFSRRRGRATVDNVLRETDRPNVDGSKKGGKASSPATDDDKVYSANKENTLGSKKPMKLSLKSRNFCNPISSLSAALSIAVKMRHSSRTAGKQDDGRSSSGNWSASSSTRASVDSDQHHVITPLDCTSSISRNSVGKDSVLSDATQVDTNTRFQDSAPVSPKHLQLTKSSLINQTEEKKDSELWAVEIDQGRQSSTSTPERASDSTNTSVALSPYLIRKGAAPHLPVPGSIDDGESSVYSVDTDGYYTSMHTDSGLWNAVAQSFKLGDSVISESFKFRRRRESQSSVSTVGNSSINSFLSRTATEVSSNQSSLKRQKSAPQPPPRLSSAPQTPQENTLKRQNEAAREGEMDGSEKSSSPMPFPNGSTSESDYEARDRIQLKTKINSSRYPSMCAVSPETSDDEALETASFRENAKSPVISVVVAEVHREENPSDVQNVKTGHSANNSQNLLKASSPGDIPHENGSPAKLSASSNLSPPASSNQSPVINMYGSHSPVQSSFSSSLVANNFLHSSPVSAKIPVTTFSPNASEIKNPFDSNDAINCKTTSPYQSEQVNQNFGKTPSDSLTSSQNVPGSPKQSEVPLKYTPRITVTPITRTKADISMDKVSGTKSSFSQTANKATGNPNPIHSGYRSVNYRNSNLSQSPNPHGISDPVNPAFMQRNYSCSSVQAVRPVARVTLDPTGKVVYSSRSLDRRANDDCQNQKFPPRCNSKPMYATLPMYQGHCATPSCSPEKSQHNNQSSLRIDSGVPHMKENETKNSDFHSPRSVLQRPVMQGGNSECQTQKFDDSSGVPQYQKVIPSTRAGDLYFRPSRGGRFCRTYFPPHLISSPAVASSKEPYNVQPSASQRSFNDAKSRFQNTAFHGPDLSHRYVTNPSVEKASSSPPSQYLNRTNNSGGFQDGAGFPSMLPESTARKNLQSTHPSYFNRLNYIQPSPLVNSSGNVHETHFRPLNPAAPAVQYSYSSNSYSPKLYSSNYDALNTQRKGNQLSSVSHMRTRTTVHNLPSPQQNSYNSLSCQEKPAVPYLDEDDSSSQYSAFSYDSGDASQEHSKPCSSLLPTQPPDVIPSSASPRSTLDITSPSNLPVQETKSQKCGDKVFSLSSPKQSSTPLKSLSANELFAIIHSSKKKHNIKSESEKSLSPLSSRSSSPGSGMTPVKGIQVETGVLGRRNGSHLKPGDRHSWDGNQSSIPEKRSLAQDRLGRTKPTSMHDFKMLLLQARSGSSGSSPRPSAAELLKVSPPHGSNSSSLSSPSRSLTSSPIKSMSLTKPQSPITTHSSLPLKRTVRTRSPYLTRYDSAYPPILEDCSEESESTSDNYPTTSHLSPAQCSTVSLEGCDRRPFGQNIDKVHESNKPNSKLTSTWV